MKPFLHAKTSAKKWGGVPEDYQDIHDFMDSSKAVIADVRHRAIFHSAFGCFIVEKVFGITRKNSSGKEYSTRDVAEQHILEDLGTIPTVEKWLQNLPIEAWMGKPTKVVKEGVMNFKEGEEPALCPTISDYTKTYYVWNPKDSKEFFPPETTIRD